MRNLINPLLRKYAQLTFNRFKSLQFKLNCALEELPLGISFIRQND